jgi:hypothetical protein
LLDSFSSSTLVESKYDVSNWRILLAFVPGHELSQTLYEEIVSPLMARLFPDVPWAAALIGEGSDVLGYDTERSMDHDWGPRLNILLQESDIGEYKPHLLAALDTALPRDILGIPIDIPPSSDLPGDEAQHHHVAGDGRTHGVRIDTAHDVLLGALGVDSIGQFQLTHWLTTPQQTILELVSGPQFRDDFGVLTDVRRMLAWYPDDLWRYQMAARWKRIAQLEAFVGRCGELGDDLGSHLVAMSLIDDAIKLAFLQERRYAPYAKWVGTAFSRLDSAAHLGPAFEQIRYAHSWQAREAGLVTVMVHLGDRHNTLSLTESI